MRKSLLQGLIGLAAIAVLTGVDGRPAASQSQPLKKVVLSYVPSVESFPIYVAIEGGFFKRQGLDLQLLPSSSGADVITAMLSGSVDLISTPQEVPILLAEKGQSTRNLVGINNALSQTLIVKKSANVKYGDVRALKGLTLAVTSPGGGTDRSLRFILQSAGFDPDKDVKIVAVGDGASQIAALKSGQIDGILGFEPFVSQAVEVLQIATPVIFIPDNGPSPLNKFPYTSIQATDKWLKSNPETAAAVVNAIVAAMKEIQANPGIALTASKKYFPTVDPGVLEKIVPRFVQYVNASVTPESVDAMNTLLLKFKAISKAHPYDAVVADESLRRLWTR